jgi:surface polysaccharide O-acyltransferase-like enzyme
MMSVVFYVYSGFINNKTDRHDIAEILLKVALSIINQTIVLLIHCGLFTKFITEIIEDRENFSKY